MKVLTFLLTITLVYSLPSMAEIVITEDSLVDRVKNNDLVLAGEQTVKGYDEYTGSLGRSFLPKTTLFAAQERFSYAMESFQDEPYYGVKVELNLYNGGRDRVKNDIAKTEHLQEQSKQKVLKFKQLEEARKTMWQAVYLKELIVQYEEALDLLQKNQKEAARRIRGGVATRSDQFEFEIKKSDMAQDMERAKLILEKKKGLLKILLGIENHQVVILSETLSHDHNWRELIEHSERDHNYLIKPQEFEVAKTQLKADLGGKKWLPELNAYVWWQQNNRRQDFDRINSELRELTNFGLQLKWNFSDLFQGESVSVL